MLIAVSRAFSLDDAARMIALSSPFMLDDKHELTDELLDAADDDLTRNVSGVHLIGPCATGREKSRSDVCEALGYIEETGELCVVAVAAGASDERGKFFMHPFGTLSAPHQERFDLLRSCGQQRVVISGSFVINALSTVDVYRLYQAPRNRHAATLLEPLSLLEVYRMMTKKLAYLWAAVDVVEAAVHA